MLRRRLLSVPLVAGFLIASSALANAGEPRALFELFTSQGCSSCPAADKLLGELADDPSVVALSVPIDYWDYLGWKDTLASPGHSARQRAYAKIRGDREVYTPQIVVNGTTHVLGSDPAPSNMPSRQTDRNTAVMSVPVGRARLSGNALNVESSRLKGPCCRRSLAMPDDAIDARLRSAAVKTRTHHDLPQCGAELVKLGDYDGT